MIGRVWGVLFVVVAGCTVPLEQNKIQPITLSLSPNSLGRSLSLSQAVTSQYEGRTVKMRFEVEITPKHFVVVGLSTLGITMFTLEQKEGAPKVTMLAKGQSAIVPRFMLFDLHLTFWPVEPLRAALMKQGMKLYESQDKKVRTVFDRNDKKLAKVVYPADQDKAMTTRLETIIQHFDIPYRLNIMTLEARSMP